MGGKGEVARETGIMDFLVVFMIVATACADIAARFAKPLILLQNWERATFSISFWAVLYLVSQFSWFVINLGNNMELRVQQVKTPLLLAVVDVVLLSKWPMNWMHADKKPFKRGR